MGCNGLVKWYGYGAAGKGNEEYTTEECDLLTDSDMVNELQLVTEWQ